MRRRLLSVLLAVTVCTVGALAFQASQAPAAHAFVIDSCASAIRSTTDTTTREDYCDGQDPNYTRCTSAYNTTLFMWNEYDSMAGATI